MAGEALEARLLPVGGLYRVRRLMLGWLSTGLLTNEYPEACLAYQDWSPEGRGVSARGVPSAARITALWNAKLRALVGDRDTPHAFGVSASP